MSKAFLSSEPEVTVTYNQIVRKILSLDRAPMVTNIMATTRLVAFLSAVSFSAGGFADTQIQSLRVDVWADNWFALYVGETLVAEDSVSIQTERSFNAESFTLELKLPAQVNLVIKDFKQNDTGLEYIGTNRQQMGDGGFIAQFLDTATQSPLLVSNRHWRCLPIHIAPLNKQCEKSNTPEADCGNRTIPAPDGWQLPSFDDSAWPVAIEYSAQKVRPKDGYKRIRWDKDARLIWSSDLETDNTLLCRVTLTDQGIR